MSQRARTLKVRWLAVLEDLHGAELAKAYGRVSDRARRVRGTYMDTMHHTTPATARRLFPLVGTIHEVAYSARPYEEFVALGARNYWDYYFAGRAAPLGQAPAEVVHAAFYNFGPGEVARHIPYVWTLMTPEQALAARERGCTAALRGALGDLADSDNVVRAGELAERAAYAAPTEGRVLYAGLRALDPPEEPVARLWHALTLLREHRGDGHIAALVAEGVGGLESHMLLAIDWGMQPEEFGRIHHLPKPLLAEVRRGLQDRGLVTEAADLHRRGAGDQGPRRGAHGRARGAGVRRALGERGRGADHPPRAARRGGHGRGPLERGAPAPW